MTQRLRLEPLGDRHLDDLVELHSDPGVAAWFDGSWSEADARDRIERAVAAWRDVGTDRWMAYERTTGALVGHGGIARSVIDGTARYDVGWVVREALWGRGYATEIGRAALDFAFDHLEVDEVVAVTEPNNERSLAVMERLGIRFSLTIRHADRPMVLYVATRRTTEPNQP